MKNQDPLNPMQNAELTSQLAQISTVEGITNLKNTLLSIGGQIDVSQSMSAVAMIGKGVLVPAPRSRSGWTRRTPRAAWSRLTASTCRRTPPGSGPHLGRQRRRDPHHGTGREEGRRVHAGLGRQERRGRGDGSGAYTVSVTASDAEGKKVAAEMLSYGKVKSVAYSTNGLRLDLGLDGQTSMLDVRKVIGA